MDSMEFTRLVYPTDEARTDVHVLYEAEVIRRKQNRLSGAKAYAEKSVAVIQNPSTAASITGQNLENYRDTWILMEAETIRGEPTRLAIALKYAQDALQAISGIS